MPSAGSVRSKSRTPEKPRSKTCACEERGSPSIITTRDSRKEKKTICFLLSASQKKKMPGFDKVLCRAYERSILKEPRPFSSQGLSKPVCLFWNLMMVFVPLENSRHSCFP
jgi:hypothetical protein